MEMKKPNLGPTARLETGAAILAAAETSSTRSVKRRLIAFAAAQRRFVGAQRKVDTADERLRAALARVAARDTAQDAALETLARALVAEGQPRRNPFAAFGAEAPSLLKGRAPVEEAKAIHGLVAAVQGHSMVSEATLEAAHAAEKAARAVEAALVPLDVLEQQSRASRQRRDTIGQGWDSAVAALRRGARAAADDGAPGLYTALFGRMVRSTPKKRKPAPTPPPAVTAVVPSAPQPAAGTTS